MSPAARKGFTLIELLVVIAIIAILSVAGLAVFTNVQKSARDAKRRADIDAIAKAYEVKYAANNKYVALKSEDFAANAIPQDPRGIDYFSVIDENGIGFKACAALDNNSSPTCNTPAQNCYCIASSHGTIPQDASVSLIGTQAQLGVGGSQSPSCDPNGTLTSGLVGYWKMDELDGAVSTVVDSSGSGNNGTFTSGSIVTGKFGHAGSFTTSPSYVTVAASPSLNITGDVTVSLWIKRTGSDTGYAQLASKTSNNYGPIAWGIHECYSTNCGASGYAPYMVAKFVSTDEYAVAGTPLPLNTYTFVAGIRQGSTLKLYEGIGAAALTTYSRNDLSTGALLANDTGTFQLNSYAGSLASERDDVRVYNRALSDSEISLLYNNGNGCVN